MFRLRPSFVSSFRHYSTSPPKTTIQLVAEIRKLTDAPIAKARQALTESSNDLEAALKWLEKDLAVSGAAKAARIQDRVAKEGLISVALSNEATNARGAIVELNCETDFVARTDQFTRLAAEIARSVATNSRTSSAVFQAVDMAELLDYPLADSSLTVKSAILDLVGRTGENVTLRRATTLTHEGEPTKPIHIGSYVHNASKQFPNQGRIATLTALSLQSSQLSELFSDATFISELGIMERALGRQIVGFGPTAIREGDDDTVLYNQLFAMIGGEKAQFTVRQVLAEWKQQWKLEELEMSDFVKWEVGQST
ncbi:elongation factor TS-domain-containing protein [Mycena floridula]|nr:elongation factor TS-domain-containing protein [Mycena floridula]